MPPEATGTGPASVLGHYCDVKFEEDSEWYRAIVRGYDRATKLHNLWYEYDGEVRPFSVTNCLKLCLPGPTSSNTSLHAIPKEASAYTALGCILDSSVPSELKTLQDCEVCCCSATWPKMVSTCEKTDAHALCRLSG